MAAVLASTSRAHLCQLGAWNLLQGLDTPWAWDAPQGTHPEGIQIHVHHLNPFPVRLWSQAGYSAANWPYQWSPRSWGCCCSLGVGHWRLKSHSLHSLSLLLLLASSKDGPPFEEVMTSWLVSCMKPCWSLPPPLSFCGILCRVPSPPAIVESRTKENTIIKPHSAIWW